MAHVVWLFFGVVAVQVWVAGVVGKGRCWSLWVVAEFVGSG